MFRVDELSRLRFSGAPCRLSTHALLLLALCGPSIGCGNAATPTPALTDWVYFRETVGDGRERYLNVQADGTYESAVLDEHIAQGGKLTDAQIEQLEQLTSESQFDRYLEESESDCTAKDDVAIQTVRWREDIEGILHMRGGCWVRMEIESAETQYFLDAISKMQQDLMK
jgi:hypothetical protein